MHCSARFVCGLSLICLQPIVLWAQSRIVDSQTLPVQLARAFSAGVPVRSVALSGDARWHAGGTNDVGTATITISSSGAAQLELSLSVVGSRLESQDAIGPAMACRWSGADKVVHKLNMTTCGQPTVWYMPNVPLQSASLPSGISMLDLGTQTLADSNYHHVRLQFAIPFDVSSKGDTQTQSNTMDLWLDPVSQLPAVLQFRLPTDRGSSNTSLIEVHYSNYHNVSGVQIPYQIERFINGTLNLEISVTSARTA